MGIWSNSRNGSLRYSVNRQNNSGVFIGPTKGLSSPKQNRRACLCLGTDTYDRRCCDGFLIQQGIGQTQSPYIGNSLGGFDMGFSSGFNGTPYGPEVI
jgi:hypothetical protein